MTHSHDWFTWLSDMTHSHTCTCDSPSRLQRDVTHSCSTWHIHMQHDSFLTPAYATRPVVCRGTWLICVGRDTLMCKIKRSHDMTHSHDSFTWLTHMTHSHDSFTWLIHMTHSHDSFTWLINMTHSHDAFTYILMRHAKSIAEGRDSFVYNMTHLYATRPTHMTHSMTHSHDPFTYLHVRLAQSFTGSLQAFISQKSALYYIYHNNTTIYSQKSALYYIYYISHHNIPSQHFTRYATIKTNILSNARNSPDILNMLTIFSKVMNT